MSQYPLQDRIERSAYQKTFVSKPDMSDTPPRPPLDGITLEAILIHLSTTIGWDAMAAAIPVRCFINEPTVKSSLKFLRRTTWARARVEQLYLKNIRSEK